MIILAVVGIPCIGMIVLGAVGYKFFKSDFEPMAGCMMAFEEVHEAVIDYANAHNATLPKAGSWQDDVRGYYSKVITRNSKDRGPIQVMLPDGDWGCRYGDGKMSGIAFNTDLSGKKLSDIADPRGTILIFEVEKPEMNAARSYKPLDDKVSPVIMGETRGWVTVTVDGDVELGDSRVRIDMSGDSRRSISKRARSSADSTESEAAAEKPAAPATGK